MGASLIFVVEGLADRLAMPASTSPSPSSLTVGLTDDDAGAALFDEERLVPGPVGSNCVRVSYVGEAPALVRMYGQSDGSGLDRYLQLSVEAGSGGRFTDCTGFSGTVLYSGSLEDFSKAHADFSSGLVAGSPSSSQPPTTFRFTLRLSDDSQAQGRSTTAAFTWEARETEQVVGVIGAIGDDGPPVYAESPPPPPGAPPGGAPASGSTTPSLPARGGLVSDRGSPTTSTSAGYPSDGVAPRSSGPAGQRAQGREDQTVWRRHLRTVAAVADKTAFPLILLLIVLLFLLVQDCIDRRDPKLALAPVHPDPDLPFTDRVVEQESPAVPGSGPALPPTEVKGAQVRENVAGTAHVGVAVERSG